MEAIERFIARLPKVELHVHLIGSASVETVLELARRHPDSGVPRIAEKLRRFYEFRDFPHFITVYRAVNELLTEPEDIADLVRGVARDLGEQNVRYVEQQFSPYVFRRNGMPDAVITEALDVGARDALASHAERIGHGIRSMDDPQLVAYLRERQLPVDVSPTSNVRTRCVPSLKAHPLPSMLDARLFVTLNSDDPPMFGTSLTGEYLAAAGLGLGAAELAGLAANGVRASFLDDAAAGALLGEIASVLAAHE